MPTTINWPGSLPGGNLRDGYTIAPRPAVVENDVALLPRRSQLYSDSLDVLSVQWVFTPAQAQAFRSFYTYALSIGTQWFNAPILSGGVVSTREVMFLRESPVFQPYGAQFSRVTATLITRKGMTPDPYVAPLSYDETVLARSPLGYWRLDEASPATTFTDLTGNGNDIGYTGSALTYSNPTLNLDGGTSLFRGDSGTNWSFAVDVTAEFDAIPLQPVTVGGWVKFANDSPTDAKTLFHLGGPGGGGQFYKLWAYRDASGFAAFSYHHLGGGTFFNTKTFSIALPLDTPFWFECGADSAGSRFFFKLNDGAYEYISWGADTPNGIDPGRGACLFSIGRRQFGNDGDAVDGYFSHYELYDSAIVALGMWPDWHL